MDNNYNVFICYRGDDGGIFAANIYSDLCAYDAHSGKVNVFFAPKCISKGENFLNACIETAGKVDLMLLIMTPDFFNLCSTKDDVVYQEIKNALKNPDTAFLPILMPGFVFKNENMEDYFTEHEISRIKYINAIQFTDVYSFSSTDMLIPIIKDKIGVLDFDKAIMGELSKARKKRVSIQENDTYFSQSNAPEQKRLDAQQALMYDFDMAAYKKHLEGKANLHVLDIGSGNGKALMKRLGSCEQVASITGIEYDAECVKKANEEYGSDNVKFFQADVESEDFEDTLRSIMQECGIDTFNWINILAVISHLKHPYSVLKAIRKFCSKGTVILIRNIDDGLNMAYPDEEQKFERAFILLSKCETTGYRKSGREVFGMLKKIRCREIYLEKCGINSVSLDYDEKLALFEVIFNFIKQGIIATANKHPGNRELAAERDWFIENYSDLDEAFCAEEFFVNIGFMLYVGIL